MALVGIVLAPVQAFASDGDQKREWQYMIALSMAYGHIVCAAIFSLSRHRLSSIPGIDKLLVGSFSVVSILVLFGLYASALQVEKLQAPLFAALRTIASSRTLTAPVCSSARFASIVPYGSLAMSYSARRM